MNAATPRQRQSDRVTVREATLKASLEASRTRSRLKVLAVQRPDERTRYFLALLSLFLLAALVIAGCSAGPPDESQPAGSTGSTGGTGDAVAPDGSGAVDTSGRTSGTSDGKPNGELDRRPNVRPAPTTDSQPARAAKGPTQVTDASAAGPALPTSLATTATALWAQLQATQPPPAPRTGGGDPYWAGRPVAATRDAAVPHTGGGDGLTAQMPPGSEQLVPVPTPIYGLPLDLSLTATAEPMALGQAAPPADLSLPAGQAAGQRSGQPADAGGSVGVAAPAPVPVTSTQFVLPPWPPMPDPWFAGEVYYPVEDNPFTSVLDEPLSTFSVDVDTASYSNVRRFLRQGALPPAGAVRIEELLNYFDYSYPAPSPGSADPFAVFAEVVEAPWSVQHRLVHIGLKAADVDRGDRPDSNMVFLIDVSGSMDQPDKLPLVRDALRRMVDELGERDSVAIVTYADGSQLVLPPTPGMWKVTLADAIGRLVPGGSTNGEAGLKLAYEVARDAFVDGGVNRVILATDGDFNVGVTDDAELLALVREQAAAGVGLTALGFGMGNLRDGRLELLADNGDGNYAYIDTLNEARKVLIEEMSGTLTTVAKDVKIQVEFNPVEVEQYRLIGYENRALTAPQFADDTVDAGEIGAGHTVTALYEVVPVIRSGTADGGGAAADTGPGTEVWPLRYRTERELTDEAQSGEMLSLRLRYKPVDVQAGEPRGDSGDPGEVAEPVAGPVGEPMASRLLEFRVRDTGKWMEHVHGDVRFASAVAAYGMLLRGSPYAGKATWDGVVELTEKALGTNYEGADAYGYRIEFLELARTARDLQP
ncbi:MAG: von Willebrand factor type A domain-containing protein [Anaerolineae bacterium]